MSLYHSQRRTKLTLLDAPDVAPPTQPSAEPADPANQNLSLPTLRRTELGLQALATELAEALIHLERAALAANGTGFTGRLREALDELDELQRSASEEFGRKVGDRLGRDTLWRRRRSVDV